MLRFKLQRRCIQWEGKGGREGGNKGREVKRIVREGDREDGREGERIEREGKGGRGRGGNSENLEVGR